MGRESPMYVFAYASLLSPASLAATLPGIDPADCVPAWCGDRERTFSVAFPNDGSEPDKEYRDVSGERPEIVRFCDLPPAPGSRVNGICIPVDDARLARLRRRELRYDEVAVHADVSAYADGRMFERDVVAFVGSARYRAAPEDPGVVPRSYLDTALTGARHWDAVAPGFLADFHRTTLMPDPGQVVALTRIDREDRSRD
ncbi:hypothetical protein [Microbacterium thalassium]|uniref:Gamma-glutamylcyclotransferase n=1 Tax=Microbacterium thalassium TaxID=362649 RepID=A0A7X0FMA9_9MICO|nr:hypothetical protein [Microbacterium thalassium]MBB6390081.1 hypothetical protein [Microbacterium thalassium]